MENNDRLEAQRFTKSNTKNIQIFFELLYNNKIIADITNKGDRYVITFFNIEKDLTLGLEDFINLLLRIKNDLPSIPNS